MTKQAVNETKFAIAALMAVAQDNDAGPEWVRAIIAFLQTACLLYLLWYLWRGAVPLERKRRRNNRQEARQ